MAKKPSKPSVDTSAFFEEPDPAEAAKARRLARQTEEPVSQPVSPPPAPIESAKERRLARQKEKEIETKSQPKKEKKAKAPAKSKKGEWKGKGQETSQNQVGASPHTPSEADKQARFYWERTFEVRKNDDNWETYCDGRLVDTSPITKSGCVSKKS